MTYQPGGPATPVVTREQMLGLQAVSAQVPVPDHVADFILRLVHRSRPQSPLASDFVKRNVEWGAGPRASQSLASAARAFALLDGHPAASIEDVRRAAEPVLRHRVIPNYNATGDGITSEEIVRQLLKD
jgi:MoxR-like ATPase